MPWTDIIRNLKGKEIVGTFYKQEVRVRKVIKRKGDKLLQKKYSRGRVNMELDSSCYATKAYLKNATGVETTNFSKKIDLNNLKNAMIKNIEDEISDIANLATNLMLK